MVGIFLPLRAAHSFHLQISVCFEKLYSCFALGHYNVVTALQVLKPFQGAPILPGLPFLAFQAQACGLVSL